MEDELGEQIVRKFVGLTSKPYSHLKKTMVISTKNQKV